MHSYNREMRHEREITMKRRRRNLVSFQLRQKHTDLIHVLIFILTKHFHTHNNCECAQPSSISYETQQSMPIHYISLLTTHAMIWSQFLWNALDNGFRAHAAVPLDMQLQTKCNKHRCTDAQTQIYTHTWGINVTQSDYRSCLWNSTETMQQ